MADPTIEDVKEAFWEFVDSFDRLEWERFSKCFTDDVTVFFPWDSQPHRANGRTEVEPEFKRFFSQTRNSGAGPRYLNLDPEDVSFQMWADTALVTFHLERPVGSGRRTLVLKRAGDRWQIVHLHASTISRRV